MQTRTRISLQQSKPFRATSTKYSNGQKTDLILNPDKSTATLFAMHTHEHNVTLDLKINNTLVPTVKNSKILGLTLYPGLNFSEHIKMTKEKAESSIMIIKALTSTSWGHRKETLFATYKTLTLPVIEHASTVWCANTSKPTSRVYRLYKTAL
jgi:hypothetical protein